VRLLEILFICGSQVLWFPAAQEVRHNNLVWIPHEQHSKISLLKENRYALVIKHLPSTHDSVGLIPSERRRRREGDWILEYASLT
jgi:hypothetical protein